MNTKVPGPAQLQMSRPPAAGGALGAVSQQSLTVTSCPYAITYGLDQP